MQCLVKTIINVCKCIIVRIACIKLIEKSGIHLTPFVVVSHFIVNTFLLLFIIFSSLNRNFSGIRAGDLIWFSVDSTVCVISTCFKKWLLTKKNDIYNTIISFRWIVASLCFRICRVHGASIRFTDSHTIFMVFFVSLIQMNSDSVFDFFDIIMIVVNFYTQC